MNRPGKEIKFRAKILIGEQIGAPIKGHFVERTFLQSTKFHFVWLKCCYRNERKKGLPASPFSVVPRSRTVPWLIIRNCYRIIKTGQQRVPGRRKAIFSHKSFHRWLGWAADGALLPRNGCWSLFLRKEVRSRSSRVHRIGTDCLSDIGRASVRSGGCVYHSSVGMCMKAL